MKISVFQSEFNKYIELDAIGKFKYKGQSFGVDSLTDGKEYYITDIEKGIVRVVDDSGEDYLYSLSNPRPTNGSSAGGVWEIAEDYIGNLKELIEENTYKPSKYPSSSFFGLDID